MHAVVRRASSLVCTEIEDPVPGPGQALLRTLACGICGSDLHVHLYADRHAELAAKAGRTSAIAPGKDIVFGHEFCGEVLAYGGGGRGPFEPGTRVVALPYATGPAGRETVGFSPRFPGGYGERLCVDASMLMAVPDHLDDRQAALVEPFAVGAHAVAQADIDADSVAMVIGCGPVGLAVIAALKARGLGPIVAADFSPARRRAAERLGADVVVDPSMESPHAHWTAMGAWIPIVEREAAAEIGRKLRKPVVFECVGAPGVLHGVIEAVAPGAQIVVVGVCMEQDRFEPMTAINKRLLLRFVAAYGVREFAMTLKDIAEGRIDVDAMGSTVVGRGGVADAFEALRRPDSEIKVVIESGRP
ncbi:MAG TPA: zinc-binding dehydrogenase [Caulobacteraceae bacterium]|jgi:threonine dehydrogenase-like Zn-dependent dehydrogenase|nr:zinc-binding dehydrogenase [Caulobacteraceae bacterium]